MCSYLISRSGRILKAVSLLMAASIISLCHAGNIDEIVAAVSQANYANQLRNHLYTSAGSNRGAPVFGPDHDPALNYIASQFRAFGLETIIDGFTWMRKNPPYAGTLVGTNIIARLPGTVHPEKQFILGAHYDSAATPGADDDASGIAGLLEAARVLSAHKFEYTILFIAFDYEEIACTGAASYVSRHETDQIVGMVEMDMIAYNHQDLGVAEIWTGAPGENSTSKALLSAMKKYAGNLTTSYRGQEGASDHGPFAAAGFDAAMLCEAEPYSPYYHKPTDAAIDSSGADARLADGSPYLDYAYATAITRGAVGWLAESAILAGNRSEVIAIPPRRTVKPGIVVRHTHE